MGNFARSFDSAGLSGEYEQWSFAMRTVLAVLTAIACYNGIEITVIIISVFKKYSGLYFWSLFASSFVGVVPYSIGFLLKFFNLSTIWLSLSLLTVGWYCMVTGQSLVLYSRLHLVIHSDRTLRNVLIMIIVNAVSLHIPTTFFTFGANVRSEKIFVTGYGVMERIQMTGFCIQEFVISGLYIFAVMKLLALFPDTSKRKLMHQLLLINTVIVIMDIALLVIEFSNFYAIQITLKGVVYSIKLKLELAVLSNLVDLIQPRRHQSMASSAVNYSDRLC